MQTERIFKSGEERTISFKVSSDDYLALKKIYPAGTMSRVLRAVVRSIVDEVEMAEATDLLSGDGRNEK